MVASSPCILVGGVDVGFIEEIWELNYVKFIVCVFKCKWVDNNTGFAGLAGAIAGLDVVGEVVVDDE